MRGVRVERGEEVRTGVFEMIVLFQFWKLGSPNRIEKVLLILPNSFDRIPRRTIFLLIFVSIVFRILLV